MPGLNGKGPQNDGPMTGRGLGRCRPSDNRASDSNFNDQLRQVNPDEISPNADPVVYGRGQGGLPRGGGQGLGQGRRMGQGRGNGGRGRGLKQ